MHRALLVTALFLASVASVFGHGSMADPISRVYSIFLEGPEEPQRKASQAAKNVAGTQAFYDWHELALRVPDHNYRAQIPDGKLPGAGRDKYAGLNLARNDWPATQVQPGPYDCVFYAATPHDPSYFLAYITKEGFDITKPLKWDDLVAVKGTENVTFDGFNYRFTLKFPERTGRHILYVIWQRIDPVGEVFFSASDLDFGGSPHGPAPTPEVAPIQGDGGGDHHHPTPKPTPTPTKNPGTPDESVIVNNIAVAYKMQSSWSSGYQAEITLTNKSKKVLKNWELSFEMEGKITSIWNAAVVKHSGKVFTVNASAHTWNLEIPVNGSVKFGFVGEPRPSTPMKITVKGNSVSTTPNPSPTPTPTPTPKPNKPIAYNYDEVLEKSFFFYAAQRSGDLPRKFSVPWRKDSAMKDGSDVGIDLTGGYYDAGDHVKFALPMLSSMTLLAWGGIEYPEGYEVSGQKAALLEAVRWGMDWVIKAHPQPNVFYGQVGNGSVDHAFWGPPEKMTMPRPTYKITTSQPGSELGGEGAAALAAASILFKDSDPTYSKKLLKHARELFEFGDKYRGKYSDAIPDAANFYNSWSGYYDELVWGAAWLYRATGEKAYLKKAEGLFNEKFAAANLQWTHAWDDKSYGSAVLLAQLTKKAVYRNAAERWLNYWTIGHNGSRITYTEGGLAWLDRWGSLRYAANTAFLAFIYGDKVKDYNKRYRNFAENQLQYILGNNPRGSSYVVGFGKNPPINPHHRAAHGSTEFRIDSPANNRHILFGALVGGPSSADDFDYQDDRTNFITNEVAMDYNAGFTGAIARMAEKQKD